MMKLTRAQAKLLVESLSSPGGIPVNLNRGFYEANNRWASRAAAWRRLVKLGLVSVEKSVAQRSDVYKPTPAAWAQVMGGE